MQNHLEDADNVFYRDLIGTMSAKLKKAAGNNFKVVVCSCMNNPRWRYNWMELPSVSAGALGKRSWQ